MQPVKRSERCRRKQDHFVYGNAIYSVVYRLICYKGEHG